MDVSATPTISTHQITVECVAFALHIAADPPPPLPQHKGLTSGHIKRDSNSAFCEATQVWLFSQARFIMHLEFVGFRREKLAAVSQGVVKQKNCDGSI